MEITIYIFRAFALILIVGLWIYTVKNYKFLPEKIPVHFDVEHKPDSFGKRKFIFLIPIFATVMFVILYFAGETTSGNFPVELTKANFEIQYLIMRNLTAWLSVIVSLIFFNIQDYTIRRSQNSEAKPKVHMMLPIVFIFLSIITAIIFASVYK